MAKQIINIGTGELTGDGETIRSAFDKVNDNFNELYAGGGGSGGGATVLTDLGITEGTDGQVLKTDGAGTYTFVNVGDLIADYGGISVSPEDFAEDISTVNISDLADVNAPSPSVGEVLKWNGTAWTAQADTVGSGGIALTDISVTSLAAAGSGTLTYNNTTGVFDYTPPDLSSYLTSYTETDPVVGAITGIVKADGAGNISAAVAGTDYLTTVAFADLTGKPTTIAGYGITDAFDGAFGSLSGKPTTIAGYGITDAFDGAYGSLTGTPSTFTPSAHNQAWSTITGTPTTISGYGITDAFDGAFGSLSGTPTTLSGYGITDAANTGSDTTFTANVLFDTGVQEKFATLTGSTGVTAMDCDNGQVFYLTGAAGDITANFTNLGLTAEYGTNVTVIINQGATPYEVTAVQIGGAAQTINWQGGSAPTGNTNGIDSFSFTILNDGGTYVVLGQMVDFT